MSQVRPALPPATKWTYTPVQIDEPGWWLILSDIHLPYHDASTVELAVKTAKQHKAKGVLLNGDILDSHELSYFDKDPTAPRYREEVEVCKKFLDYLVDRLPKTRIIFKQGNHEERLERYVMRRAEAIFGMPGVNLQSFLGLEERGIEWVGDKRIIRFGHLNVIHGHEYTGPRVSCPVNPARGIFLRAKGVVVVGHWHQTSEHHEPTISGKPQGAWSTGCACQLNPPYSPLGKWNNGFAMVENYGKAFSVRNLRVMDGVVV